MPNRHIGAFLIGMEWYKHAVCSALSDVFGLLFFSDFDPQTRLMLVFGTFAISTLGRPIGAIIFGMLSDKKGREKSAYYSFLAMMLSSLFLSLLPSYSSIGISASILFVILRFLQGIAVGGSYGVSFVMAVEKANICEKYLAGSMVSLGFMIGFCFGTFAVALMNYFLNDLTIFWIGWRFVIWIGLAFALPMAIYFPKTIPAKPQSVFISSGFSLKRFLYACGAVSLDMVGFYMFFMFLPNYKISFMHQEPHNIWIQATLGMFVMFISTPFLGKIADAYGGGRILKICALSFMVIGLFAPWNFGLWIPFFGIIMAVCYSSLNTWVTMIFPKQNRARLSGLVFNLMACLGGVTPIIASKIIETQNDLFLGVFLSLTGLIAYFCINMAEKERNVV